MNLLSEHEMVAFFIGKRIDHSFLSKLRYQLKQGTGRYCDCVEYDINLSNTRHPVGILPLFCRSLKRISLTLIVYSKYGVVTGARIYKYKKIIYTDRKCSGYETTPGKLDIKRAANVLRNLTMEGRREKYESNSGGK